MSFYVKRIRHDGRTGWVGPIRSEQQAGREQQAWQDAGYSATVHPSTPEVRKEIRAWERERKNNRPEPEIIVGFCQHCGVAQFDNPNADPADAMASLCWKCVKPWKA